MEDLVKNFVEKYPGKRSCFILGSTGEIGKRLVRDVINSGAFSLVKVISRRQAPAEFVPSPPAGVRVEQIIVQNLNTIPDDTPIFKGCDFGFCALGTTKKKAGGAEEFYKIDHDLTLKLLRLAKSSGCHYLALVSAIGASSSSIFLYSKTKGKLENDVIELQFNALRVYRPGMIEVRRAEVRIWEEVGQILAPIADFCTLGRMAIKADTLAKAMLLDALKYGASDLLSEEKKLVFIGNKEIKNSVPKPPKTKEPEAAKESESADVEVTEASETKEPVEATVA